MPERNDGALPRLAVLGSSISALAIARNAADIGLRPTIFGARNDAAFSTRRADFQEFDPGAPLPALEALHGFAARGAALLIATSDRWLRFVVANRACLQAQFVDILHPGNVALATCLDKTAFSEWCVAHSLPAPRAYSADMLAQHADTVTFPVLVRPANSNHAARAEVPKAVEARTPDELARWLDVFESAQQQAFVTASLLGRRLTQYSVGAARSRGKMLTFVAVKRRPTADLCGVGSYVELCPDERIETLARRALEALEFHGIGEVEILRDEDTGEDWLIEINARPWVQYGLGPASGHELLDFMLRPDAFEPDRATKRGQRWLNFSDDLYYCFARSTGLVRNGRVPLGAYLKSIARANTFAYFSLRDLKPLWSSFRRLAASRSTG